MADWSEDFVEIQGPDAPQGSKPMGWEATKVKMLWDDERLDLEHFSLVFGHFSARLASEWLENGRFGWVSGRRRGPGALQRGRGTFTLRP